MKMPSRTRREFIKTTTLAAASVSFAGALASRARAAEPDRKIGFALAGLGNLSTHQLAPALQKTKYCRLTGIITGHSAKAERWQAQYNIPDKNVYNYDTMEKMADNPDIDVVYVVTPNGLHAEHAIEAAKAGKHVLCEKPMEVSVEKCQQMIDACKQAGRQLAIGYRLHFEPNNLECVRLAREKVFGDLKMIEAGFGFAIGDPNWRSDSVAAQPRAGRRRAARGRGRLLVASDALSDWRGTGGGFSHYHCHRPGEVQGSGGIHRLADQISQRRPGALQCHVWFPRAEFFQGFRPGRLV
jgi:hypothetical protein